MGRELIAVVGPTCTGKGALALALADALGGPAAVSIVACDSAKIYRGADVGTAKITGAARRGYEFFMVDVVEAGAPYSAGRYMSEGRAACEALWRRGKLPLVVGGTGLYFRALLDGICEAPPGDAAVRAALRAREAAGEDLHKYLSEVDAEAAAHIAPADTKRIVRALEVFELSGIPLTKIHKKGNRPLEADEVVVALDGPRRWLRERIELRTRRMLAAGLLAETRELLAQVERPEAPPLNAIGYRQMVQLLRGELDEETAAAHVVGQTRRLAKRQRTWFKREARAKWLDAAKGTDALVDEAAKLLRTRLKK